MVPLKEEEIWTQRRIEGRPCEDTGKRQPYTSPRERPQKRPALQARWLQTPGLQNWERIDFYCLSPSVCGILLRQPQQTNIPTNFIGSHVKWATNLIRKSLPSSDM